MEHKIKYFICLKPLTIFSCDPGEERPFWVVGVVWVHKTEIIFAAFTSVWNIHSFSLPMCKEGRTPSRRHMCRTPLGCALWRFPFFFFFLYYVSLQYEHKSHNKKIRNKPRRGMARMAISDLVDQWPEFSRVIKISEG